MNVKRKTEVGASSYWNETLSQQALDVTRQGKDNLNSMA